MKSKRATKLKRPGQFAVAPGWPSLRWTAEKPKRRGWWWVLDPDFEEPRVLRVDNQLEDSRQLAVYSHLDGWQPINTCPDHWRWAGPLPEPDSASGAPTTANVRMSDCERGPSK